MDQAPAEKILNASPEKETNNNNSKICNLSYIIRKSILFKNKS